jgi:hypothetical protein
MILLRFFYFIVFLLAAFLVPVEAMVYGIRWILTGKPFPDPLCSKVIKEI